MIYKLYNCCIWNIASYNCRAFSKLTICRNISVLNKFQRFDITHNLFLEYNDIKLEINNKRLTRASSIIWNLSTPLLNNSEVKKKFQWKLQIFFTKGK